MHGHLSFLYNRLSERLWVRPVLYSLLAVLAAVGAAGTDSLGFWVLVPRVDQDIVEKLLSIIAASMLGVATFAVGSMVSAYASVSGSATPRAFALVVSDDTSKTALSTFIAAFIFSVIALVALKSGIYGRAGIFFLFLMTIGVLAWVVFTFVRWVDQIARLGRVGTTIERVERAAETALEQRRRAPTFLAMPLRDDGNAGEPIHCEAVGYVQHIDVAALQRCAEKNKLTVSVAALPGTFVGPGRALAHLKSDDGSLASDLDKLAFVNAFLVARERHFDDDPRFGLIALSEIAARALSPAVNDPGTAISIIGVFVRLFVLWTRPLEDNRTAQELKFDRVYIPPLATMDMFDDAFTAISRDGAGTLEVVVRLQKAFISLATIDNEELRQASRRHSRLALERAQLALRLPEELDMLGALAAKVL